MIAVKNVSKVYENGAVGLDNVNFEVDKGEFVFIVGTSGSGKSTLVRSMLREVKVDKGSVVINNYNLNTIARRDIPYYRRSMGVVFQDFRLLSNKTVYDNVAFAMEIVGASRKEIARNVPAVLAMVGLHRKMKAFPNQLSGGEQQRTALARAIVNKPPILLADEPTGNLDPTTAWDIMQLLEDINAHGTTVIVATHAKDIVDSMQKRVITLKKGQIVSDVEGGYHHDL